MSWMQLREGMRVGASLARKNKLNQRFCSLRRIGAFCIPGTTGQA